MQLIFTKLRTRDINRRKHAMWRGEGCRLASGSNLVSKHSAGNRVQTLKVRTITLALCSNCPLYSATTLSMRDLRCALRLVQICWYDLTLQTLRQLESCICFRGLTSDDPHCVNQGLLNQFISIPTSTTARQPKLTPNAIYA